jgi:hypothetical protein
MFQEHLLNLRKASLKLNLEKCQIFQKEIWYLRHTVSPEGITTNPNKLKAVWEWPTPNNKHIIKIFLGLCTYYKRFISSFAKHCETTDQIHREEASLSVDSEVQAAFQTLKETFCNALFLLPAAKSQGRH